MADQHVIALVDDEERIAWHEAGHAVAGHLYRRRMLYASTVHDGDSQSGGHVQYAPHRRKGSWDWRREPARERARMVLLLCAGQEVEAVRFGTRSSSVDDENRAAFLLQLWPGSCDPAKRIEAARAIVRAHLQAAWLAVNAVAEKLFAEEVLGSCQISRLIRMYVADADRPGWAGAGDLLAMASEWCKT